MIRSVRSHPSLALANMWDIGAVDLLAGQPGHVCMAALRASVPSQEIDNCCGTDLGRVPGWDPERTTIWSRHRRQRGSDA
jgi:hypothetical protein